MSVGQYMLLECSCVGSQVCLFGLFDPVNTLQDFYSASIASRSADILQTMGSPEGKQFRGMHKLVTP